MTAKWIEQVTGSIGDKKRWRQYKARKDQLPPGYRTAIDGLERYITYAGTIAKSDVFLQMVEDLADLFEGAAAEGIPIRGIVGEDPVEFAEDFLRNYTDGQWINKERRRLKDTIDQAAEEA